MKSIISLEKYDAMKTSCFFHDLTCELSVCNGSAPRPTNILRLILFSLLWESLGDSDHFKPSPPVCSTHEWREALSVGHFHARPGSQVDHHVGLTR